MASGGEARNSSGLVQKLTPFVKDNQVFSKSVQQNGGEFKLVKSVYRIHTSPAPVRKSVSKDTLEDDVIDGTDWSSEGNLMSLVRRRRTSSIDSQGSVEEELALLRKKVEQQEQSLESLKLTILSVREESTCQKVVTERVQTKFRSHRSLIDRTLRQTQMALQEQQAMLYRQETLVQKIEQKQVEGSSVFLESAYVLMGMYVIQTPLVKYTIHLISARLDQRGRHTRCVQSVFSWMGTSVKNVITRLTGFKQNMLTYDSSTYQNWVKSSEENRQGFNLLDEHRLINTTREISPTKSLNIC